jgi:hypothetical protein
MAGIAIWVRREINPSIRVEKSTLTRSNHVHDRQCTPRNINLCLPAVFQTRGDENIIPRGFPDGNVPSSCVDRDFSRYRDDCGYRLLTIKTDRLVETCLKREKETIIREKLKQ